MTTVQCQNCDWKGDAGDVRDINHLWERVQPGEVMPYGECPECGALCHKAREPLPTCGECGSDQIGFDAWVDADGEVY